LRKKVGNINVCLFTTGILRKNKPIIINTIPKYFHGSSNLSPKTIIAHIDSNKALNPSQTALTNNICEPCNERIKKYMTPI
jgi:hypothetical protein